MVINIIMVQNPSDSLVGDTGKSKGNYITIATTEEKMKGLCEYK